MSCDKKLADQPVIEVDLTQVTPKVLAAVKANT